MPFDTATTPGLNEQDADLRVLLRVRDSLSGKNAWLQGDLGEHGQHCVMGWVYEHLTPRFNRRGSPDPQFLEPVEDFVARRLAPLVDPTFTAEMRASRFASRALSSSLCSRVVIYNDERGRSQADMVRLLDLAIEELVGGEVEPAM